MSSPAKTPTKTDPIHYFGHEGQFGCFSNRCECYPFDVAGKQYKSVEAYFQSQKFHPNEKYMEQIRNAPNSKAASKLGKTKDIAIRADWDAVKEETMRTALFEKFNQHRKLGALLVSTHGREIRFGKSKAAKKDPLWGWDGGKGENKMGVLVASIRTDLKEKADKDGVDVVALIASETKSIHRVEYAKTGRAACKACDKAIEKKELRIGKRVIIRYHESYIWFHWECYFTKNPTPSVEEWDGFAQISEDDKTKLRSKVDLSAEVVTSTTTSTQKAKEYARDCLVEYATSNRSACKWCKTNITKDTVRIAIQVKSFKIDGKIPHWHHVDCFFEKAEIPDLDCMDGLKSLRWEDQQLVTTKFGRPASTPLTPPSSPKPKKKVATPTSPKPTPKSPAKGKAKGKAKDETPDSPKKFKRKRDESDSEDDDDEEEEEEEGESEEDEIVDEADAENDLQQLTAMFWRLKDKVSLKINLRTLVDWRG